LIHLLSDDASVLAQLAGRAALPEMSDGSAASLSLSESRILLVAAKNVLPDRRNVGLEIRSPEAVKRVQRAQH
jgi:hypothetical protein